ncbi:gluconate 2-dehydrogenase subunit 3 family protein [Oceanobacillus sp. AG]|uniref:gluconate 2-dehydrogenase subunit 3 family protein n=1 Tax=Oceanobacillus sp. AG TaxID=2681969 RepID=UPI001E488DA8|nr:gluconate 2-dehydrogenase subunit 3 family protein [Oceanobacillus sp. AG]
MDYSIPFQTKETTEEVIKEEAIDYSEARLFFKQKKDFDVLSFVTERIFPEDENGPGAIKLGVPYFIDKQLAGSYGSNKFDYMKGPVQKVKVDSSYQTLMTRGEVFIEGVRKLNDESLKTYDAEFFDLEGEQQDEILTAMEAGEIELRSVKGSTFFNLLRQMTIEGAYADPLYGGNKNMMRWKMKEHPGIRAGYSDLIEEEEFQIIEQMSSKDYQS